MCKNHFLILVSKFAQLSLELLLIVFVALLCIRSNVSMSCLKYGLQACTHAILKIWPDQRFI